MFASRPAFRSVPAARRAPRSTRRGSILVLSAFLMVAMLGMVAFALDSGYILSTRTELQSAADAGALAGAARLVDGPAAAEATAQQYAQINRAAGNQVQIVANEDLELGQWNVTGKTFQPLFGNAQSAANAVRVTTRLDADRGNEPGLFFARIFNNDSFEMATRAIAVTQRDFKGFTAPPDGSNLMLLPYAIDKPSWDTLMAGSGTDNWSWDASGQTVLPGMDGIAEINMFPAGNHLPGNRGTVDIGPNGGKTNTLRSQILNGIPAADLNYHGGSLELNGAGKLNLSGAPGVKATLQSQLKQIVGQTRIIPIFDQASGQGTNAQFQIVGFGGVRIMYSKLSGNPKQLVVQPASVVIKGGIPADPGQDSSQNIFSRPYLAQ